MADPGPARPHGRGDGQPRRLPRPRPPRARAGPSCSRTSTRRRPSHERPHRDHERRRAPRRRRGTGGRSAGGPRPRLPRAVVLVAPPDPRAGRRRVPGPRARPARVRPLEPARARSSTTTWPTSPTTSSACSTTSAPTGPRSSATTGARWWCGSRRCMHPERVTGVVGMSVPFMPAPADAADRDAAPGHGRQLLLHDPLPGAGRRRGRPRSATRPRRCAGCCAARRPPATRTRGPRPWPACSPPARRGSSSGWRSRTACPTGSARTELDHYTAEFTRTGFTGGVNWYRNLDRNWEMTRAPRRGEGRGAVAVHRRRRRPGAGDEPARRERRAPRRPPGQRDRRGRGPLGAAGEARRGQRARCSTSSTDSSGGDR